MITMLVKVTVLFLVGLIAFLTARRATAAMRHLLCVCTLAGSLLLPLTAFVPASKAIAFHIAPSLAAAVTTSVIAKTVALHWLRAVPALWALGSALVLLRIAAGYWRIGGVLGSAAPVSPGVYLGPVSVPIATGLIRPVVLLPRMAADWPEWQRAAALRHERAHIERGDLPANFIAQLACALYWFHPLVWVLASMMRRVQEAACDDAVIHAGFEPATYAEALLAVARNSTSTFLTGCAMTTQNDVKSRILRLLDSNVARAASIRRLSLAAIAFSAAVAIIGLPIRAQEPYQVGGEVKAPRVISKVDPQYTEEARRQKIEGPVLLSVVVGTDGMAHDISVIKSLDAGLDRMAAEAIEKWHFAPGTRNGEPVAVRASIEVNFRLQ